MNDVAKLYKAGASTEMLLVFMRESGFLQIDSIIALRRIMGKSLQEAKETVDESKTWSDQYEQVQAFREIAWRAIIDLSKENNVNLPKISIKQDSKRS